MPKGIGYGPKAKKKAAKKAVKQINKTNKQAVSKRYGVTVQKKTSSGGTIGYANVKKTKLPPRGKVKTGTGSPQHKRSVKMSKKKK